MRQGFHVVNQPDRNLWYEVSDTAASSAALSDLAGVSITTNSAPCWRAASAVGRKREDRRGHYGGVVGGAAVFPVGGVGLRVKVTDEGRKAGAGGFDASPVPVVVSAAAAFWPSMAMINKWIPHQFVKATS